MVRRPAQFDFRYLFCRKLNVTWPEGLESLSILAFDHPEKILPTLEDSTAPRAVWPRALRKLVLGNFALVC